LLSGLAILFLICLTPLRLMTQGTSEGLSTIVSVFIAAVIGITLAVAPLLAGTLSVGEERASGTQTWNLVLPMSIRRQWMLKFITGLLTCLASQALVLVVVRIIGGAVFDKELNLLFNAPLNRLVLFEL